MEWNGSDVVAIVAVLVAFGQFVAAEIRRSRERNAERESQERDDVASIATIAAGLIWDAHLPAVRDAEIRIPELRAKWQACRDRLLRVSVAHPNPAVRTAGKLLANALQDTVEALEDLFLEPLKASTAEQKRLRAEEAHTRALAAQNELLDAL